MVLALLAPTLLGCGTASGGGGESVAWVDRACGVIATMIIEDPTRDDPPTGEGPSAVKEALESRLDREIGFLDARLAEVNALGGAPMDGGDELTGTLRRMITGMREGFTRARAGIAKADVDDPAAFAAAEEAVMAEFREVAGRAGAAGREINKTVGAHRSVEVAWNLAENCGALSGPGG